MYGDEYIVKEGLENHCCEKKFIKQYCGYSCGEFSL